jgi:hypothetical protein
VAERLRRRPSAALPFAADFEEAARAWVEPDRLRESAIRGAISGVGAEVCISIARRWPKGVFAPGRHAASGGARLCGSGSACRCIVG